MREKRVTEMEKGLKNRAVNVRKSLKHSLALVQGEVANMRDVVNKEQDEGLAETFREKVEKGLAVVVVSSGSALGVTGDGMVTVGGLAATFAGNFSPLLIRSKMKGSIRLVLCRN